MNNRHERRKAEKMARTQFSKEQLAANWREAQAGFMQMKSLYREQLLENENLRRKAYATQLALLSVLAEQPDYTAFVDDATIEEVQMGLLSGWYSDEVDQGIEIKGVPSEEFEDDAE